MEQLLRVSVLSPKAYLGQPVKTVKESLPLLSEHLDSHIMVLPAQWLTPPSLGSFLSNRGMLAEAEKGMAELMAFSENYDGTIITSLQGVAEERIVLISGGQLLATYSAKETPIFYCGTTVLGIVVGDNRKVADFLGQNKVEVVVNLRYSPVVAGQIAEEFTTTRVLSSLYQCGIATVNGGLGDTSSPLLYRSFGGLFCCGETLSTATVDVALQGDMDNQLTTCVVLDDVEELPFVPNTKTVNTLVKQPYLPQSDEDRRTYFTELFDMQVQSLAVRMTNIGAKKVVMGVSGGLDSTLTLLVCIETMKALGLPTENVVAITMPGFGTSGRTYQNATNLIKSIGATFREISIVPSVTQHFIDIGHDISNRNVAYENAQARERTQILMDVANDVGGFVVGTGDLSEEALGWCTFGGDQLANFNVNVCLTKSMVRSVVALRAESYDESVSTPLVDILNTPVSPELLPADDNGAITQKTEEILGPYELHDFFLYYFGIKGFTPEKTLSYSMIAFPELEEEFIKEKLQLFIRRLSLGQFKRACAPDGAVIAEMNLCNVTFAMPSDMNMGDIIGQLHE